MAEVPADTPVNIPDDGPIVATPVVPDTHVPPLVASLKVVVDPAQTVPVPVMAAGSASTVKEMVAEHPPAL